jgi:signal peptidase I
MKQTRSRIFLLFLLDVVINAVVIIFLVFVIRAYIIYPFQIHGPSMCDTFNNFDGKCVRGNGEYIMIYKLGYQNFFGWQIGLPDRGDVVIFQPPNTDEEEYYIKRVIGIPGDRIEIIEGYVYLFNDENPEGLKLDESDYLNDVNWGNTETQVQNGSVFEVPEGEYFTLGDNRKASSDSRRCFVQSGCEDGNSATVPLELIEGKAWLVLWPFDRMRVLSDADSPSTDSSSEDLIEEEDLNPVSSD